jgi:hypothetical protein
MPLIINIPPDIEHALTEKAQRAGQTVAEFARAILAQAAGQDQDNLSPEQQGTVAARLSALQQIGSYDTRTRAGLEPLADHALDRESIYEEGHW